MFVRIVTSGMEDMLQLAKFSLDNGVLTLYEWEHTSEPVEQELMELEGFKFLQEHVYSIPIANLTEFSSIEED